MRKKYKLAIFKPFSSSKNKNKEVKFHYQVYIQEEQSIHPKDIDEIEY